MITTGPLATRFFVRGLSRIALARFGREDVIGRSDGRGWVREGSGPFFATLTIALGLFLASEFSVLGLSIRLVGPTLLPLAGRP